MEEKKEFSKYMQKFLERNNYKLEYISEVTGVALATIGHYKTGIRTPKDDFVEKFIAEFNLSKTEAEKVRMAVALDRTPELIKNNYLNKNEIKLGKIKPINLMEVPLFKSVSAGLGCDAVDDIYDFIAVPKIRGNIIAIEVNGNSMEDTIMDGAVIVVNKDILPEVGEIGVFLTTGTEYPEGLVKRLKNKNGHFILESDNPQYDDILIESKNIVACGKVINILNGTRKRKKDPIVSAYDKLDENDQAIIKNMIEALSKKNK